MNLPDLAKPWPVRFTGWPDFLPPPDDRDDPGDDEDEGDREEYDQKQNPTCPNLCQSPCKNERGPEENTLRDGGPTTRVLREFGILLREVSVYKDRSPDAYG